MVSCRTALMVKVSAVEGLREATDMRGEFTGIQGRWNCPGGRFWKGLGKRSGVEIWMVEARSRMGVTWPDVCGGVAGRRPGSLSESISIMQIRHRKLTVEVRADKIVLLFLP